MGDQRVPYPIVAQNKVLCQLGPPLQARIASVYAGELSPTAAWVLCLALAAGGLALTAANFGTMITSLYAFGLFLGTIYSVPPLRLKRFAIPAFLIIATVRALAASALPERYFCSQCITSHVHVA